MSDSPARDWGGPVGDAKPKDLPTLVADVGMWRQAQVRNTNLIAISLNDALPTSKHTAPLLEQVVQTLAALAQKWRGRFYQPLLGDLVLMVEAREDALISLVRDLKVALLRAVENHFPGSFGTIDQSRLVICYDLAHNYRSAADRITRYAGVMQRQADEGEAPKLRPLTGTDIEKVMAAYKRFGAEKFVKTFVRRQPIAFIAAGKPPQPMMTEIFVSMDLLRKPLFIDVEMRGSGRLFQDFTLVLDQIMLEAFPTLPPEVTQCSLNLNVESVFTSAFEQFVLRTPARQRKQVVFEFRQANIVERYDEFQVARELIGEMGAAIAVDQIFPQTMGLVDIGYLGARMAKIHWRQGAEDVLHGRARALKYMLDCGVMPILIRVDNPHAFEVGSAMGITAYQGFYVDGQLRGDPANNVLAN